MVEEKKIWTNEYNGLYRLSARYEYHPKAGNFGVWAAPSLNIQQYSLKTYEGNDFKSELAPYSLLEQ